MIKFKATTGDGRKLYAFGLSRGNYDHLKLGHPILINMEEMGSGFAGVDFMIFGDGKMNEVELAESLQDLIGPDTVVHGSPDPVPKH